MPAAISHADVYHRYRSHQHQHRTGSTGSWSSSCTHLAGHTRFLTPMDDSGWQTRRLRPECARNGADRDDDALSGSSAILNWLKKQPSADNSDRVNDKSFKSYYTQRNSNSSSQAKQRPQKQRQFTTPDYLTSSYYHIDADDYVEPMMLMYDDNDDDSNKHECFSDDACEDRKNREAEDVEMFNSNKYKLSIQFALARSPDPQYILEGTSGEKHPQQQSQSLALLSMTPPTHHYLAIEELRSALYSCWLCGCDWQEDHISLDCSECGGYGLTRPCPKCDGECKQVWKRNINATHDRHKALWAGRCGLEAASSGSGVELTGNSAGDDATVATKLASSTCCSSLASSDSEFDSDGIAIALEPKSRSNQSQTLDPHESQDQHVKLQPQSNSGEPQEHLCLFEMS